MNDNQRFVDYVFLAGLPYDFRINQIEKENHISLSSTTITNNNNKTINENDNKDKENALVVDSLFESICNSITKFDQERDEFLKSLGREVVRSSTKSFLNSNNSNNNNSNNSNGLIS